VRLCVCWPHLPQFLVHVPVNGPQALQTPPGGQAGAAGAAVVVVVGAAGIGTAVVGGATVVGAAVVVFGPTMLTLMF
jgi:hypothetical protein